MIKYIEVGQNDAGQMIYGRIDEDGLMRVTCTGENPDYLAWVEAQNETKTK